MVNFTDKNNFFNALNAKVTVARFESSKGRHSVTSKSLYQKRLISPESERRTLQNTTQQDIRTIIHPYLSHQFKTNDQALRYNMLKQNVFADTIHAGTVSRSGN